MTLTDCWIKHLTHLSSTLRRQIHSSVPGRMRWKAEAKPVPFAIYSHQVSSGLRGLSLLLPRWHRCVCCYRSPAQHCNGKLLKGFLSLSQSSSISTAERRKHIKDQFNHQNWHLPGQNLPLLSAFSTRHNWWSAKKKIKNLGFPKKQQLANFIILYFFCTAWHLNQTKLLITACERKGIRDFRNWAVASLMELKLYQPCTQRWRKR